jgi:TolB-like protein
MSFFDELKRRNVIKVAIAYVVIGWLVSQVAEFATENFGAPEWVLKTFVVFLLLGLPLVLTFAWAFEMTPEGIKREKDVDRSQSITGKTGRKLDFTIIGVLVLVAGYFIYESRFAGNEDSSTVGAMTTSRTSDQESGSTSVIEPNPINDNSIAVLPFANRSLQQEDEFFTDGIHDDLLTQLAKIRDLKVISRTSMMKYKDTELSIPDIARELGVSTILEGGVQRAGKRIRINAQLIDVSNDQHLWAETFDREMTMENIFDIQSEITRQIVTAVRGELTEAESQAISDIPTTSIAAYEAYLRARTLDNSGEWSIENYIEALPLAERAVELDPRFAQAWSLLARIHGQFLWFGYDTSEERIKAMKKAVDMATLLAPDSPWSLEAQAEYHYRVERDFESSLRVLKQAHEAMPGNTDILERTAMTQRRLGLMEESVSSNLQVLVLDPGNVSSARLAIETLSNMGEWDRLISLGTGWSEKFESIDITLQVAMAHVGKSGDLKRARQMLDSIPSSASETWINLMSLLPMLERDYQAAIDIWDHPAIQIIFELEGYTGWRELQRGVAWSMLGEEDKSKQQFKQALELLADLTSDGSSALNHFDLSTRAAVLARLGKHEEALNAMNKARELAPENVDVMDGRLVSGQRAQVLGIIGRRDEALAEIERLLDKPWGLQRWYLYLDPYWDFFRDDERFNELIKPLNLDEAQR